MLCLICQLLREPWQISTSQVDDFLKFLIPVPLIYMDEKCIVKMKNLFSLDLWKSLPVIALYNFIKSKTEKKLRILWGNCKLCEC